jgi:hypothetical protein
MRDPDLGTQFCGLLAEGGAVGDAAAADDPGEDEGDDDGEVVGVGDGGVEEHSVNVTEW